MLAVGAEGAFGSGVEGGVLVSGAVASPSAVPAAAGSGFEAASFDVGFGGCSGAFDPGDFTGPEPGDDSAIELDSSVKKESE